MNASAKEWFIREPGPNRFRVSGETVRQTEIAMARTAKGLCPGCAEPVNEDGVCSREECR